LTNSTLRDGERVEEGKRMYEKDRLEEIARYVRKTHRWVVVIGVIVILSMVLSFCGALLTAA